jgi:hypothetical protein
MKMELKHEVITISVARPDWEEARGDSEALLLRALERHTRTPWRLVCPSVVVERVEPYRTSVLPNGALQALRERQKAWQEQPAESSGMDDFAATPLELTTNLYAPLTSEAQSFQ